MISVLKMFMVRMGYILGVIVFMQALEFLTVILIEKTVFNTEENEQRLGRIPSQEEGLKVDWEEMI